MDEFRLSKRAVLTGVAATLDQPVKGWRRLDEFLTAFNRLDYPEGLPSGRGHRAGYDIDQFWKTIFAFQISNFGLSMPATVEMAKNSWDIAYSGINLALGGPPQVGEPYWMGWPARLSDFAGERTARNKDANFGSHGKAIDTFMLDKGNAGQTLEKILNDYGRSSAWFVDVRAVVTRALAALEEPVLGIDPDQLQSALQRWRGRPANQLATVLIKGIL